MRFKKYYVFEPEAHMYPHLQNDTSKKRINDEIQLYNQLKASERLIEVDGGYAYFLINSEWVTHWRKFVQEKGPHPGPVNNEPIAKKIHQQRSVEHDNRYAAHDNKIGFHEPQ